MSKVVRLIWVMSTDIVVHTDDDLQAEHSAYASMISSLEAAGEENETLKYVEDSLRVVDVVELQ